MKIYKRWLLFVGSAFMGSIPMKTFAQQVETSTNLLNVWRIPPSSADFEVRLKDFDGDGDPDLLYSETGNHIPILWIDDNDDMQWTDMEGDIADDCLLIDRNKDGKYGALGDLIIDWVDNDEDGKADMQVVVDYPRAKLANPWPNGHYMWVLDTDGDQVFNYIDWNTMEIKAWDKSGLSDFFLDYSGKSAFMKIHVATYTMDNLKLNWENPFLFYDPDRDGLTEMAIRMVDSPKQTIKSNPQENDFQVKETGFIDWVSITVDMDNDNAPGNDFDYDMTIGFRGKGFNYMDQIHRFPRMRGLPATDKLFMDPRWRQLDELIYTDHDSALPMIFGKGNWNKVYFVFDEDDDCNRWERVEFLDPLDPFKSGTNKGGLDNNVQADMAGDRGEWDLDNSGKGKLYIGRFDGRIHLYGAEWGAWRIDQNGNYYQGWDRKFLNKEIGRFPTVKYVDTDNNGFIDKILYDLDGNFSFEDTVRLKDYEIKDESKLIDISTFTYHDYRQLMVKVSNNMWHRAQEALKVAQVYKINTTWYAKLKQGTSESQKYSNGYWLQFYLYRDLKELFMRQGHPEMIRKLTVAYYTGNWEVLRN